MLMIEKKQLNKVNPIEALKMRESLTPDIEDFAFITNIPVFVYGTLKKNMSNHRLLENETFVGEGSIDFTSDFNMKSTSGFPVVYRKKDFEETAMSFPIMGEVYAVSPEAMTQLDRLESNGFMYQRELLSVTFKDGTRTRTRDCWVYLGLNTCFQKENLYRVQSTFINHKSYHVWERDKIVTN